jgi:tetratricopeptide (TPR) repeat protein
VALPLIRWPAFWQSYVTPRALLVRMILILSLLLLLYLFATSQTRLRFTLPVVTWLLFGGWLLLACLLGPAPQVSVFGRVYRYEGWLGFAAYAAFFFLGGWLARGRLAPARLVSYVFVTLSLVLAIGGLAQQFGEPHFLLSIFGTATSGRSEATLGNPVYLGLLASLFVPILVGYVASDLHVNRMFSAATLALLVAVGFLTYSRAAWTAIPVGIAVAAILGRPRRQALPWLAGAALTAFAVILITTSSSGASGSPAASSPTASPAREQNGAVAQDLGQRVNQALERGGGLRSRWELAKGAVRLILEKPLLGRGLETYYLQAGRVRTLALIQSEGAFSYADRPHNSLLYIAYAAGIPGLALYILLIIGALVLGFRRVRALRGPGRIFAAGLFGGCIGYVFAESVLFPVADVTPLFWFVLGWLSLGVSQSQATALGPKGTRYIRARQQVKRVPRPPEWVVVGATVMGASAIILVATVHSVQFAYADHLHNLNARAVLSAQTYDSMVARERQAARLDPHNAYYWNELAKAELLAGTQLDRMDYVNQARADLLEGLRLNAEDPTLVITLSNVELTSGHAEAAIALLEPYLLVDKFNEDGHFNIALAYMAVKNYRAAAEHLERAVTIVPNDAEAYFQLSKAYAGLGKAPLATQALDKAGALDPQYKTKSAQAGGS